MISSMHKILITGGAGFIGSHLANSFVDKGHHVKVIDSLSEQVHGLFPFESNLFKSLNPKVEFIHASITSEQVLTSALNGIDVVVHLAAETGTGQSMYEMKRYSEVNVLGTATLLESIARNGLSVRKLIVASTRAVYGEGKYSCLTHGFSYPGNRDVSRIKNGFWEHECISCGNVLQKVATDEDSKLDPQSIYGITKLTQEQMVLAFGRAHGLSAYALRLQNVYGPGQSLSNPYTGILSVFSTRILTNSTIHVYEDGLESRDFVYVSDVIDAFQLILNDSKNVVDVFNVGSGKSTTVLELARKLNDLFGKKSILEITGNYRIGDIRHNLADIDKIKNRFSFSPKVLFDQGITKFVSWVKLQPIQTDKYEHSISELRNQGLFK